MIFISSVKTFAQCFHNVACNLQINEVVCRESLLPVYFFHWVAHCEASLIWSFNRLRPVFRPWQKTDLTDQVSTHAVVCQNCTWLLVYFLLLLLLFGMIKPLLISWLFSCSVSLIETPQRICFKISCCLTYKSRNMQCNIHTKLANDKPQLAGLNTNTYKWTYSTHMQLTYSIA